MKQITTLLPDIKLVGITCRTSNKLEMNPESAQIGKMMQEYFGKDLPNKIVNRKNPGTTFCVYTNYKSDFNDEYSYYIGEEVTEFDVAKNKLQTLTIAGQNYTKFTTEIGQMPDICIEAWQNIWEMSPNELNGTRAYLADFEIYDHRASDPYKASLDIYIGLKK